MSKSKRMLAEAIIVLDIMKARLGEVLLETDDDSETLKKEISEIWYKASMDINSTTNNIELSEDRVRRYRDFIWANSRRFLEDSGEKSADKIFNEDSSISCWSDECGLDIMKRCGISEPDECKTEKSFKERLINIKKPSPNPPIHKNKCFEQERECISHMFSTISYLKECSKEIDIAAKGQLENDMLSIIDRLSAISKDTKEFDGHSAEESSESFIDSDGLEKVPVTCVICLCDML